jgi:hypothetical protein
MPATHANGVVSVSIDTAALPQCAAASTDAIGSVVVELFDRFQKQRLPATWFISDPKRHTLTNHIARTGNHELALVGNDGTIARLLESQRIGLTISSISENPAWRARDVDLLAKYGISVIRTTGPSRGSQHSPVRGGNRAIQPVRYGLWHIPVAATLHGGGWMPYFAQFQRLKRTIDQAVREGSICHVRIDAPSIARGDVASGLRAVERLLTHINHLRSGRSLVVESLHDTAIRLHPKRTLAAARSILRAA